MAIAQFDMTLATYGLSDRFDNTCRVHVWLILRTSYVTARLVLFFITGPITVDL